MFNDHILRDRPKALIFDLDGTLLDTEPLYSIASQRVLDPFGLVYTDRLKKRAMGGDSRKSAQLVIDEYKLPLNSDEYLKHRQIHLDNLFKNIPEISGAKQFLMAVAQRGVKLGLATSSSEQACTSKLADKIWRNLFDAKLFGDNQNLKRPKPAPDIFLLCAESLNIARKDCIVFEDSPNGVKGAVLAGMRVCALRSVFVQDDDLKLANMLFSSFNELLPFTQDW